MINMSYIVYEDLFDFHQLCYLFIISYDHCFKLVNTHNFISP